MFEAIPRNVRVNSGECMNRSWGMSQKILKNFKKIPRNVSNFKVAVTDVRYFAKGKFLSSPEKFRPSVTSSLQIKIPLSLLNELDERLQVTTIIGNFASKS